MADEKTKGKIADRDWIDATGKVVDEKDATAARYTLFSPEKFGAQNVGQAITWAPKTDDPITRMVAIFGANTRFGNIANTWIAEKGDKADSPIVEMQAWLDYMASTGDWVDRTGGIGARVDRDVLAQAIVALAADRGKTLDVAAIRAKLDSDTEFFRGMNSNAEVKAEYSKLQGKTVKTLDELFADV